ncbi:type VI secretion system-associated FHA domain protein TagH [Pseudomonas sp. 3A(2025)]
MQLILEIRDPRQREWVKTPGKRFVEHGGVIGRHQACDWVLADPQCHVSKHHALISYEDGRFLLTDTSRNGTHDGLTGERLPKGVAQPIEHGSCWLFGHLRVHARLERALQRFDVPLGEPAAAGSVIPDNAFLELGPLEALLEGEPDLLSSLLATNTARLPAPPSALDGAGIDTENLTVPRLIAEAPAVAELPTTAQIGTPDEAFWQGFAAALGVPFEDLAPAEREPLALSAAALLRQSLEGLQHSLRIRSELKNELRLGMSDAFTGGQNPLKHDLDGAGLLALLRRQGSAGQPDAAQAAVSQAIHTLQAHQVALLNASRTVLRSALEQVAPQRMIERMERDNPSWLTTDGRRWRAYVRHHQRLCRDDDWTERLLARDFARAYAEQVRLISPLQTPLQG